MKQLSKRNVLLIGITLFSMFFGAGNLIFPPFMGYGAGANAVPAFAGFVLTAVVFPVLGVTAVAKSGGLDHLCEKIHPKFAFAFSVIVYLCIGPMLAIPRTAGTSYSMFSFLTERLSQQAILGIPAETVASVLFSLVFFVGAGLLARHPERFKDILGKIMTPVLILLIVVMFAATLMHGELPVSAANEKYCTGALSAGFVDGYQTMDTLAAMVFGIVVAINIRALGVKDNHAVAAETIRGGVIAGLFLALMYGMLTFVGMKSGSLIADAQNGTDIMTAACRTFFGAGGSWLLAAIYFIACFNVGTGLISSCAEFFALKFPALSFHAWIAVLTVWSFLISIAGLNTILAISVPVLSVIYPVAIAVILMNLIPLSVFRRPAVQRIISALALLYGVSTIL